jgi:hypothetical protein
VASLGVKPVFHDVSKPSFDEVTCHRVAYRFGYDETDAHGNVPDRRFVSKFTASVYDNCASPCTSTLSHDETKIVDVTQPVCCG